MDKYRLYQQPKGWEFQPLSACCDAVSATCDPSSADGQPYLGLEHLASGAPAIVGVGDPHTVRSAKTVFQERDVLYGKLRPYLRKAVLTPFDGICSTDIIVLRSKSLMLPEFLVYLLHSDHFVDRAKATTSGVNHPRTSWSKLKPFVVPVPPLSEQKKIAALLAAVQRAVEQQERLIALTTELKKALMHKLFTEGTRGEKRKDTEIGPVPESWSVVPLHSTGEVIYGIQAAVANNTMPIGTKIITNKNITLDGDFDFEKQSYFQIKTARHRATILKKGDILFNWRSGSKEHLGKTAFFDLDGEWTHSSFILRIRPSGNVSNRFLFYYLLWLRESHYFVKLHTYMVNAKFNKSAVNALPTALPERSEQDEIAYSLDAAVQQVSHHRATHAALTSLFHTLLHQLMTAQMRVDRLDLSDLGHGPAEAESEEAI